MTHQEKLILKQQSDLLDHIKRQNLTLESFATFLGFECRWEGGKPVWERIPANKRGKRVYLTVRPGEVKRRPVRGLRPGQN